MEGGVTVERGTRGFVGLGKGTKLEPETYFEAMAVFIFRKYRRYRIFLRSDELVFIWAGSGGEGLAGARAVRARGGLNAVIGSGLMRVLDPSKKNTARREVLDSTPLTGLLNDHPYNLRLSCRGVTDVRILPRSDAHARGFSDHSHQAILRLRHETVGRFKFGISSVADVQTAMRELPRLFGDRYHCDIEIPQDTQPCGCRFCRNG